MYVVDLFWWSLVSWINMICGSVSNMCMNSWMPSKLEPYACCACNKNNTQLGECNGARLLIINVRTFIDSYDFFVLSELRLTNKCRNLYILLYLGMITTPRIFINDITFYQLLAKVLYFTLELMGTLH